MLETAYASNKIRQLGTTYEINTNRGDVTFSVGIVCESKEQARFSDARVSDQ
jgi:hypothetical protein